MIKPVLVITATLGERETLRETIESVRKFGGDQTQHIIICPEEKITCLKEKYGSGDVVIEPQPQHLKGIYKVLNYAFGKYAKHYEYVTFLNDDDYWLPNYSDIISRALTFHDDLVYGKTIYVDEKSERVCPMTTSRHFRLFLDFWKFGIVMLTQQSVLFKSALFYKLGGFCEDFKLVSDTKFWIDISLIPELKYRFINKECAAYRIMKDQLSSDKTLLSTENSEMLHIYRDYRTKSYAKIMFRAENVMIYLNRFIKGQGIRDPFNR